jgi:hypothetical protein
VSVLKISYSLVINDKNESRREVAEYLVSNGHLHGFTLYEDSNILVELSDGKLQTGALNDDLETFFLWSTPARFYGDDVMPGDFIVLPEGMASDSVKGAVHESTVAGYDVFICP